MGLVYLMGYFQFNPGWLLGVATLLVLRQEWQENNRVRREVLKVTSDIAKVLEFGNLHHLPTWVAYPDVESAEWANKILKEIWPHTSRHVKSLLKNKLEAKIHKKLKKFSLGGFKFCDVHLGEAAPRIHGLKSFQREGAKGEIILDIDISYTGDGQVLFTISGMSGGLTDIHLHGKLRVIFNNFNDNIPFLGGIQMFFINEPSIDFDYVGVVDLFHTPGLNDAFKKSIIQKITGPLTFPRKASFKLSKIDFDSEIFLAEIEGVLRVHVVEAKDLENKDNILFGKSDPYAVVTVGMQKEKTKIINNSLTPVWDFWCEFCIECSIGMVVKCDVYDHDTTGKDELLGRVSLEMGDLIKQGHTDKWIHLNQVQKGQIHLETLWLQPSELVADLDKENDKGIGIINPKGAKAALTVFVHSANNIESDVTKASGKIPCPEMFVIVGNEQFSATINTQSRSPTYDKGFHFLVRDPRSDEMIIKFVEKNLKSNLGEVTFQLSKLLEKEDMKIVRHTLPLQNSERESSVVVSMKMRALLSAKGTTQPSTDQPQNDMPLPSTQSTFKVPLHNQSSNPYNGDLCEPRTNLHSPIEIKVPPEHPQRGSPSPLTRKNLLSKVERKISSTDSVLTRPSVRKISRMSEHELGRTDSDMSERRVSQFEKIPTTNPQRRHNSMIRPAGKFGMGRIQITMRYAQQRNALIISVHKIQNLPVKDPRDLPDPYVKMHLLPGKSKETKRKTQYFKDDCNPQYDETFLYLMSQEELTGKQLEVTVYSKKNWKDSQLGHVTIDLSQDFTQAVTAWYDLQPMPVKLKNL